MKASSWLPFCLLAAKAFAFDLPPYLAKKLLDEDDSKQGQIQYDNERVDNSIDPERYLIGGGDAFQIAIKGLPSHDYHAMVNSDGNIYVGEFGEIALGKIPLKEALAKIRKYVHLDVKRRYDVYVTLKQVKRPVVTVMGGLASPGTYQLNGTDHLLEALKAANNGYVPGASEYNLRQVECRSGDAVRMYDVLKYLAGRDSSQNPYVYPGDRIEVRYMDQSVLVAGQVLPPVRGRVSLLPGENAGDFIRLLALKSSADPAYILLRKPDGPPRKITLAEASSVKLEDNDVIIVPSRENYGTQDTVHVSGEVVRPGTYPVVWGKTTAQEVLELAGGPTERANPKRSFVVRLNKIVVPGQGYAAMKVAGGNGAKGTVPPQPVRPEISSSLNDMVATSDYALIRLANFGGPLALESGDEIHVPRKESLVYLSGYVANPGAYPYREGKGVSYYVGLAKGYTSKADRDNQVVYANYNGITQVKDGGEIEEGDIIVVPASVENKTFSTIFLPISQVVVSLFSLGLSIVALTR